MTKSSPRLLVTGSRYATGDDYDHIWSVLKDAFYELAKKASKYPVLVYGGAPGADDIAARIWLAQGGKTERHDADWSEGNVAGPIRNQKMVDLGADLCVAFPMLGKPNKGTYDCAKRAEAAGIPVWYRPLDARQESAA